MTRDTRRSGARLILAGVIGITFFILTDPRSGLGIGTETDNAIDAVHNARTATYVGITGSSAILVIGLWLMTRRAT